MVPGTGVRLTQSFTLKIERSTVFEWAPIRMDRDRLKTDVHLGVVAVPTIPEGVQ